MPATDPNKPSPAPGTPGWTPDPSVPSLPTNALGGQNRDQNSAFGDWLDVIAHGAEVIGAMYGVTGIGAGLTGAGAAAGAGGAAADAGVAADAGAGAATIAPEAGFGLGSGADAAAQLGALIPADAGVAGGLAGAGGASATLPELTVTAPSTAAGGGGFGDFLQNVAPIATAGLPGISGTPSAALPPAQTADFSQSSASNTPAGTSTDTPNFLSASDTSPSFQPMSGDMMQSLGIDPSSLDSSFSYDTASLSADNPGYGPMDIASANGQGLSGWLSNPKNLATLGSLGVSALSGSHQPKLPAASSTAAANATALTKGALPIIQSGGTAGPQWASQKASIDATIDNEIKQQSQAIQQAAVNSGEGNQNSGIVQQQIAAMTQQANLQRQELYTQAQQQNVQNAITELTGGDALLAQIGNMQLSQEERAQQIAAQTAQLALRLYSGSSGVPGP